MANEHWGHRSRLFARLQSEGLSGFQPHEVIELLLCYAIPVRDVNALAHRLADEFGGLDGVLSAPRERLMEVPGVGERTAGLLAAVRSAMDDYFSATPLDRPKLTELKHMASYMRDHFAPAGRAAFALVCLSAEGRLQNVTSIDAFDPDGGALRRAAEAALKYRSFSVVLIAYSPSGAPAFSERDMAFTRLCSDLMTELDVSLLDSVAISPADHLSMRRAGALKGAFPQLREPAAAPMWVNGWFGPTPAENP